MCLHGPAGVSHLEHWQSLCRVLMLCHLPQHNTTPAIVHTVIIIHPITLTPATLLQHQRLQAHPSTAAVPLSACVCPLLLRCEIVFENARTPSLQCCMYSLLFYFGCGVHNQFTVDHLAPADADVPHQLCILQCASFDWHGHNFYGCNKQFCLSPIFYGIILLFHIFCNFL